MSYFRISRVANGKKYYLYDRKFAEGLEDKQILIWTPKIENAWPIGNAVAANVFFKSIPPKHKPVIEEVDEGRVHVGDAHWFWSISIV